MLNTEETVNGQWYGIRLYNRSEWRTVLPRAASCCLVTKEEEEDRGNRFQLKIVWCVLFPCLCTSL